MIRPNPSMASTSLVIVEIPAAGRLGTAESGKATYVRQATKKIDGISDELATFLEGFSSSVDWTGWHLEGSCAAPCSARAGSPR